MLFLLASVLWTFAGEVDDDTRSRHDRATSSSEDDDDDSDDDDFAEDHFSSEDDELEPSAPIRIPGQLNLATMMVFDRLRGTSGGEILRQDGLGFGVTLDVVGFFPDQPIDDHLGVAIALGYSGANILRDFRPSGESYSSDLDLHFIEFDVGPRWESRGLLEFSAGLSAGLTWIYAAEDFSDGLALDETLAFGARLRPYVSIAPARQILLGRPFVDLGAAFFAGHITEHLADYDSLIAGLRPLMATPYIRAGHLLQLSDGFMVGLNYQFELIGATIEPLSYSHKVVLLLRLSSDK